MAHHPGFSCPLCRSFSDLESDVEVDVPEGYLCFGAGGAIIGGLEGVLLEESHQQQQQRPAINIDDTSELARASEAIYISGNLSSSGGLSGSGTSGQQQQQYVSNATPPVTGGPMVHNENSENESRENESEGPEPDAMITSEVEDHERGVLRPSTTQARRGWGDQEEDDDDDDDELVDPGARAARRMMYYRGQTTTDGEEEDEDEEDEVHAHVASV